MESWNNGMVKTGMLEGWHDGKVGSYSEGTKSYPTCIPPNIPAFQYSNIPSKHILYNLIARA